MRALSAHIFSGATSGTCATAPSDARAVPSTSVASRRAARTGSRDTGIALYTAIRCRMKTWAVARADIAPTNAVSGRTEDELQQCRPNIDVDAK
jgi:hypothetical protein